jgi:tetrapyrrole methylase family protein / MazG family protein
MSDLIELKKLVAVVARLRQECPWDKVQTHKTLTKYLIEEAHEAVEAIENGSMDDFREELGDVLLQVVLHAEIAKQDGNFDLESVARGIAEKMIRRHPHVFGEGSAKDAGHVRENWEKIKAAERGAGERNASMLAGVPVSMPSLTVSQRYGEKASSVKFDWANAEAVWGKVKEEIAELEKEFTDADTVKIQDELGDVFFALSNFARHLGIDAETAAKQGARKFAARFAQMEKIAQSQEKSLSDFTPEQLEQMWDGVKRN